MVAGKVAAEETGPSQLDSSRLTASPAAQLAKSLEFSVRHEARHLFQQLIVTSLFIYKRK